jgi:dTDP-4-dehydrorhamnose reductase
MHKKILITGAKGMLGSVLYGVLRPHYSVIGADYADFDITNKTASAKFLNRLKPEAVIHCAAYTDVDKAEDEAEEAILINTRGVKNLAQSLKNRNILFVYFSTDYIFDGRKQTAYLETDKPNPLSVYGLSKLKGEKEAALLEKYLIVRTSWLFGPGGKNFVDTLIDLARKKEIIEVVNDQRGSPTYTFDLSKAIKSMLDIYFENKIQYGIYNITNSSNCSWFELASFIVKLLGLTALVTPTTSDKLLRKAKRPHNSVLCNDKFQALTGYSLPSWQEAVKNYLTTAGYIKD